jgi:hypothetical protein
VVPFVDGTEFVSKAVAVGAVDAAHIPADITITHNHIYKPLDWQGTNGVSFLGKDSSLAPMTPIPAVS